MDQPPAQADADEYTPTKEELREISEFLRQRSLDEASAAGMMESYTKDGLTVQVRIPGGRFPSTSYRDEVRRKAEAWVSGHTADRFMDMAHQLANLGDALADAGVNAVYESERSPIVGPYRVRSAWGPLTKAARLWEQHPDFKALWAASGE